MDDRYDNVDRGRAVDLSGRKPEGNRVENQTSDTNTSSFDEAEDEVREETPRRSIRRVELGGTTKTREHNPPPVSPRPRRRNNMPIIVGVVVALVLLVFGGIALTSRLTNVEVAITPATIETPVNIALGVGGGEDTAEEAEDEESEDGELTAPEMDALAYEVFTFNRVVEEVLDATGEEEVSERASGEVIVYNDFSAQPERLIANTRFEAPDGNIYRVRNAITIPGRTASGPGELVVTVYADEPGEGYNLNESDVRLSVPGLEGDSERFRGIYAISTTPMSGGFEGVTLTVDEEEEAGARETIANNARAELQNALAEEVPSNFVVFENSGRVSIDDLVNEARGEQVAIRARATFTGIMVSRETLSRYIIEATDNESATADANFLIRDAGTLAFSYDSDDVEAEDIANGVSGTITGTVTLVPTIEIDTLKGQIYGENANSAELKLEGSNAIADAEVSISPAWVRSVPNDDEKITVTVEGGVSVEAQ